MQWESLSGHHLFPRMNWLMVPQCSAVLWLASVSTFICTLCASSLFSLPSAFTVFLRVVDPRQDFFSLPGLLCTHQAVPSRLRGRRWVGGFCWVPLLVCRPRCTQSCTNPWARSVSSSPLVSTNTHMADSLAFSLSCHSTSVFSLPSVHCTRAPEHAGRINGPRGGSWRVVGERGGGKGEGMRESA